MMAFSGVLNSWLILARNSLFARLAASARVFSVSYSRASTASSAWCWRSRATSCCSSVSFFARASSWRLMAVTSAAVSTSPPSAVRRSLIWIQRPSAVSASRTPSPSPLRLAHDRGGGGAHQVAVGGAGPQQPRLQPEPGAEILVGQQQPPCPVPHGEGLRGALDGVAQPQLRGLGARLGQPLVGDVQRHADDDAEPALAGVAERLAARVDPQRAAALGEGRAEARHRRRRGARRP